MTNGGKIPWYRIVSCWHKHEEWFDITNIDATIEKVRACPMRDWGKNLLCAHTDLFPDEWDIFKELKKKANNLWNQEVFNIISFIKAVNQQLDNVKRASHIHWSYGRNEDQLPVSELWSQTRVFLTELNTILDQSLGNKRDLNKWERTQFEYLIIQTQKRSKEILEWALSELE